MTYLNVEIKARCNSAIAVRNYLHSHNAVFKGIDEQTDTYFNVNYGRLKLREGNIENNLIFYDRPNKYGPKNSQFTLVKIEDVKGLKETLIKSCGIKIEVRKRREIYYRDNVKFHIDVVPGLGEFVEIEAGNLTSDKSRDELLKQCNFYLKALGITEKELVAESYSDLLLASVI